jgi:hypothetical protein
MLMEKRSQIIQKLKNSILPEKQQKQVEVQGI